MNQNRRRFLRAAAFAPVGLALPWLDVQAGLSERRLSLYHTHTGERLSIVYHDGKGYLTDSLERINDYLRDFRTDERHPIDTKLLDQLFLLQVSAGSSGVYEVISGYRSPRTNAGLRKQGRGVAKKSLHMQGRAIDLRLTDVPLDRLRRHALALKTGGVGYYKDSNFIHLDTGRFRTW